MGGKKMFYNFSEEELRSYCRTSLESLETWARRLIHEEMTRKYGGSYMDFQTEDGNCLIKKEVRDHVDQMRKREPGRFPRAVDTLFIDDLIYFLCHPKLYGPLFKEALDHVYPQGRDEAREFLNRLVPVRNALSHANPISVRQGEQAVCYSNDFIDGLKAYYKEKGLEKVWNVPRIIRVSDSLGNVFDNPLDKDINNSIFVIPQTLRCGDTYAVSIEVDSSFSPAEYDIIWEDINAAANDSRNCHRYCFVLSEKDVGESRYIHCKIISHKKWHKYTYYDCEVVLGLTVLPPVE